jgi:hypothetical protein
MYKDLKHGMLHQDVEIVGEPGVRVEQLTALEVRRLVADWSRIKPRGNHPQISHACRKSGRPRRSDRGVRNQ